MAKAAGGDELAGLFGLTPDLPRAANRSDNASLPARDPWRELGPESPDGAAPGPAPGSGGAEGAGPEARVRVLIGAVYWVVCAVGLAGNLLVLYLMRGEQGWRGSAVDLFVTNLALTDLQFVLTLPFWAAENALDSRWPFGKAVCRVVSAVTSVNTYAGVSFLTSMGAARCRSVASALESRRARGHGRGLGRGRRSSAGAPCALLWAWAALASLPTAVFSTTVRATGEDLCLVRFPDRLLGGDGQLWLGLYDAQKVLLGFVLPLGVTGLCYLRLLRLVSGRRVAGTPGGGPAAASARRRARVTRSVTAVVLAFFLCWLPSQALTARGVLIKLDAVAFRREYLLGQAYAFPVSVCPAHANSGLNPVLYCLARRQSRRALRASLWRLASAPLTSTRPFPATAEPGPEDPGLRALAPLRPVAQPDLTSHPPGVVVYGGGRYDPLPSGSTC